MIRWFPDRRGMATGMAIMGFGGGAIIGAPLKEFLLIMFVASFFFRVPSEGWRPDRKRKALSPDAAAPEPSQLSGRVCPGLPGGAFG